MVLQKYLLEILRLTLKRRGDVEKTKQIDILAVDGEIVFLSNAKQGKD